jgi:AraC-like DNA-binding protein
MDEAPGSPAWRLTGSSMPALDITVSYADENRNQALLGEWQRQVGDSLPPPQLTLPRHSEGDYRVRIRAQKMLDLVIEDQHSDAVAGDTGGDGGHHEDRIVTHITLRGEWRFTAGNQQAQASAGTLCVRRNDRPWNFEVARNTRAVAVVLPVNALRFPTRTPAVTADQTSPAARLLLAQLRLFAELSDDLGPAAATASREATVHLFQGLLEDQARDDVTPALLEAARTYIEKRLLVDPHLNPQAIASGLHVSVRTLYRVFAQQASASVMAYVRQRRLERARAELISTRLSVSELAARWHFADGSHFVKAYKKHFQDTPSASRRPPSELPPAQAGVCHPLE